jgi:hypothetical protein
MAKYKFQISRRSIMLEVYWVEADSEEEALEIANDGNAGDPALDWIDWMDDQYEVDDVEIIDPLYRMVKDYKSVDKMVE